MKVLIVEDDHLTREIMGQLMKSLGLEPVPAKDGISAWMKYREDPVPLVLIDRMLPGISGDELCRRIRSLPGGDDAYIIMVTALSGRRHLETGLSAGADDYATKPLDTDLFRGRIRLAQKRLRSRMNQSGNSLHPLTKSES
ncbi:MAG: response regulator [Planctomycetota bacterium]|nr:response regulator [Planctomycetota bacterium]MDA1142755.1 response regulator [Planctomycetota bacterium]